MQLDDLEVERRGRHKVVVRHFQAGAKADRDAAIGQFSIELAVAVVAVGENGHKAGHRERIGFFAAKPRLGERDVVGLEETPVRLCPERQALAVALWERAPGFSVENIAGGEVVEGHAEGADDAPALAAPPGGKLKLVGRFFFQRIFDVHRAALGVHWGVDAEVFRVEIAEVDDLAL